MKEKFFTKQCHNWPKGLSAKIYSATLNIKNLTVSARIKEKKSLCSPHNTHNLKLTVSPQQVLACLSVTEFLSLFHETLNGSEILYLYW